jgi:hypothetical protein
MEELGPGRVVCEFENEPEQRWLVTAIVTRGRHWVLLERLEK